MTTPETSETYKNPQDAEKPKRVKFKRLLVTMAACAIIGIGVQFISAINDNSVRNAISLIAGIFAIAGFAVWVYRAIAISSPRWIALLITASMLALPATLFRIRGFSGEIIPQIEFRFAGERQVRKEPLATDDQSVDIADAGHIAPTAFSQFLGSQRNAIVQQREFKVPASADAMKVLWRQPIGEGWSGFSIVGGRCITLEQRGNEECVTCYRLADGELLWIHVETARHENPLGGIGPRSMPTIVGDRVYTQGATGIVNCLELATGKPIWRRELLKIAGWQPNASDNAINWGRSGSPLVIDDICVLPLGGPDDIATSATTGGDDAASDRDANVIGRSLIALDANDGTIRWTAGDDQISYASPIRMTLAGVDQIVTVNENTVQGHAVGDGQVLWSTKWSGQSNGAANCSSAMQFGQNSFWIGKAYGQGSALYDVNVVDSGLEVSRRWRKPSVLKTKFTHPAIVDEFAYAISDGTLECISLGDANRMWAQPRGTRYGHGHLILVEDVMVVQTEPGDVAFVAVRTDKFEEILRVPALASKSWNIPSVAGRYLAVRNDVEAIVYQLEQR
ncbi:MAG TPA: oxidoreductase [Planctomycetaceae bacterium]|nr:oxidoreductase [Planctomycetaceae bacterium]